MRRPLRAPYDLLAAALDVRPDRLRGIVARWRHTGYAETGTLAHRPGLVLADHGRDEGHRPELSRRPVPPWDGSPTSARCWPSGCGSRPARSNQDGRAWWRSERRIRAAIGGRVGIAHIPDAEVHWPSLDGSPYAGQVWAIEAELTPKPLARTVAIMRGLLARTSDYGPGAATAQGPRYAQVVYLAAPAARPVVTRAIAALPAPFQPRIVVRDLPEGAVCEHLVVAEAHRRAVADPQGLQGGRLVAGRRRRRRGVAVNRRRRDRLPGRLAARLATGPVVARRRVGAADDRRLRHRPSAPAARLAGRGPGPGQ